MQTEKEKFSEYLERSREQLHEAATRTPVQTCEYEIKKYCNLPVKEETTNIAFKPKQRLLVDWLFTDIENPEPFNVRILESLQENIDEVNKEPKWNTTRFQKWLLRNSKLLDKKQ
jgi:hypothetical protein